MPRWKALLLLNLTWITISQRELNVATKIFKNMDTDLNGHIELQELKSAVQKMQGFNQIKVKMQSEFSWEIVYSILDCEYADGKIGFHEFLPLCMDLKELTSK